MRNSKENPELSRYLDLEDRAIKNLKVLLDERLEVPDIDFQGVYEEKHDDNSDNEEQQYLDTPPPKNRTQRTVEEASPEQYPNAPKKSYANRPKISISKIHKWTPHNIEQWNISSSDSEEEQKKRKNRKGNRKKKKTVRPITQTDIIKGKYGDLSKKYK